MEEMNLNEEGLKAVAAFQASLPAMHAAAITLREKWEEGSYRVMTSMIDGPFKELCEVVVNVDEKSIEEKAKGLEEWAQKHKSIVPLMAYMTAFREIAEIYATAYGIQGGGESQKGG